MRSSTGAARLKMSPALQGIISAIAEGTVTILATDTMAVASPPVLTCTLNFLILGRNVVSWFFSLGLFFLIFR